MRRAKGRKLTAARVVGITKVGVGRKVDRPLAAPRTKDAGKLDSWDGGDKAADGGGFMFFISMRGSFSEFSLVKESSSSLLMPHLFLLVPCRILHG